MKTTRKTTPDPLDNLRALFSKELSKSAVQWEEFKERERCPGCASEWLVLDMCPTITDQVGHS